MTTTTAGLISIESYDKKKLKWSRWVDRFELMFTISGIADEKKLTYLLHYMGEEPYNTICDKLAPTKPAASTYKIVVDTLQEYYEPKPLVLVENFKFHKRYQLENESSEEFLTILRKMAITCSFGAYLDTALRNQFVFGLKNSNAQRRCLEKAELTLKEAYEIALAAEMAEKGGAEIQGASASSNDVMRIQSARKTVSQPFFKSINKCYRCGYSNHLATDCKYIKIKCNRCGKIGHLEKVCQAKSKTEEARKKKNNVDKIELEQEYENLEIEDYEMYNIEFPCNNLEFSCNILELSCNNVYLKKSLEFEVDNVKVAFEIDTGSPVSIIGCNLFNKSFRKFKLEPCGIGLRSYCNTPLKILGFFWVKVKLNEKQGKLRLYVVNMDKDPIVGRDWIVALQPNLNSLFLNEIGGFTPQIDVTAELEKLKEKYSNVFKGDLGKIANFQAKINLKPGTTPVFMKHRSVPFALKEAYDNELDALVESGVLVKVQHSNWATPIVPVRKANGAVRLCGDYKLTVNPNIIRRHYPLPTVDQLFSSMAKSTSSRGNIEIEEQKFSKLDLRHAYLQLEVDAEDQEALTLSTYKGLYRPTRYMFGLANGPEDWQSFMDQVFGDMENVAVFFDDIKVTGRNRKEHLNTLEEVLKRLSSYNMRLNLQKCEFFQDSIQFCGYEIDKNGLHKLKEKVNAINQMPAPKNKDEVRAFVGLVNYYGRFFRNLSTILYPLNNLLKQNVKFVWDRECEKSLKLVKDEMQTDRVLVKYDTRLPVTLACDASPYGVGAVISHIMPDGKERPIKFASKTLSPVQQRYSQIDREAYAIIFGVKYFHDFLFGREFTLLIDNKALSQILSPSKGLSTLSLSRMQHYAIFLQNYQFTPKFRKNEHHGNADAMSRLPLEQASEIIMDEVDFIQIQSIETLPITVAELAKETHKDAVVKELLEGLRFGKNVQSESRFGIEQWEFSLQQNCLIRGIRAYIPKSLRERVLNELHESHFGMSRMKSLARSYCWWPKIDSDIEHMVKSCNDCQLNRPNPPKAPIHSWEKSRDVFERVHVDYAGPFNGKYFFILVDSYSKWPEIFVVPDMTTETTIRCCRKIFSTHGSPEILVSDHGTQFTSNEFQQYLKVNGIRHKMGAPYHPATNGLAERMVGTMKQKLKSMNCSPSEYEKEVCKFLLTYRKTIHPTSGQSPSMAVFKRQIRSRLDIMIPVPENEERDATKEPEKKIRDIQLNSRVAVREYRNTKKKWALGKVIKKLGKLHYMVLLDNGLVWKRHIDQMRLVNEQKNSTESDELGEDRNCNVSNSMRSRIFPIQTENAQNAGNSEFNLEGEDSGSNSNRGSSSTPQASFPRIENSLSNSNNDSHPIISNSNNDSSNIPRRSGRPTKPVERLKF